ncbi:MAG: hypothetical protein KKF77_03550 [Proteobacteria bacterium]|nr:hypothetical protein [Pseudomonadota bacterium]
MPQTYATSEMSPYALLGAVDLLLREVQRRPEVERADKTACMLLGLDVNELRRKYMPKPARVPLGAQYTMLAGAPEAEQAALLGQAG